MARSERERNRLRWQGVDPDRQEANLEEKLEAAVRALSQRLLSHGKPDARDWEVLRFVQEELGINLAGCVGDEVRKIPWYRQDYSDSAADADAGGNGPGGVAIDPD